MICVVTIIRYPKYFGWAGVLSMALFHLPLMFNKKISFYKLMGSGKDGSFSKTPDWRQWTVLIVCNEEFGIRDLKKVSWLISSYHKFFNCQLKQILLQPLSAHGLWDGKKCFGDLPNRVDDYQGKIAVLTRATIRLSKAKGFWQNVPTVNDKIRNAEGLIASYGIGEVPYLKQATLSIWENTESMKNFSYKMKEHKDVIVKTRKENWYSEEMFARFAVIE